MKTMGAALCACIVLQATMPANAQDAPVPAPVAQAASSRPKLVLPRDTPVRLMVMREVSTKESTAGQRFPLRVDAPVMLGDEIVIPVGTKAVGEVVSAERSGNVGRAGALSARLIELDLGTRTIRLDGQTSSVGKSGKGEVIAGIVSLGILGLFAKGNNAKLKAGEIFTGFIGEDVEFAQAPSAPAGAPQP